MLLLLASLMMPAMAQDAEAAWLIEDAEAFRWPASVETNIQVTELSEGTRVAVVSRDGDEVRVREGSTYGWVPAALLTDVEPEAPSFGDDLPPFKLPFDKPPSLTPTAPATP